MALNEDKILGRVLNDFIDDRPTTIVIHRPQRVRNERRGVETDSILVLSPQDIRIIPFKRRLTLEFRDLPTERLTNVEYILVLKVGQDVRKGDWFEYQGEQWNVDFVAIGQFHRRQAGVVRRNKELPDG